MSNDKLAFPKDKIKILLLENISESAIKELRRHGYEQIECHTGAMSEDELITKLPEVHILGIRSKTKITAKVLEHCPKMLCIGAFCIGTNQIDLEAAKEKGIAVFNSPFSNTRSVAELVLACAVFLIRRIPEKARAAYLGKWIKDSTNSHEIREKVLGIVGFGNIGSQVAALAESFGMCVIYFDLEPKLSIGNAKPVDTLGELLERSDIVSLHIPQSDSTAKLIGPKALKKMKKGSHLINYSRGTIVDIEALREAIESGHIAGAAIDVFPVEPKTKGADFETPLQGLENVILTPHIGGSTEEAQWNIGSEVSSKIVNFVDEGKTVGSVSIPELNLPRMEGTSRVLNVHRNVPGVIWKINQIIHERHLNVAGQYLKTADEIGYVVTDIEGSVKREDLVAISEVDATIKHRILY